MPYRLRAAIAEGVHHVTARGNNRESIFMDDHDFLRYLWLMQHYQHQFQFGLLAYALMTNHVHLQLRFPATRTLSQVMQHLTLQYAKYFNRRHGRVGHVFQGRFFSRPITDERDLLVVSRYIHLNPVRAHVVRSPGQYPWSSYRAYIESSPRPPDLVQTSLILQLMAPGGSGARHAYQQFVESPLHEEMRLREADLNLTDSIGI
jgi:REP element-mobilizing transposase RayT